MVNNRSTPLSERLRPSRFSEVVGQESLIGPRGYLTRLVTGSHPVSILLFGPPGSGKTTLARLYARSFRLPYVQMSGVFHSTQEVKKLLKEQQENPLFQNQILLFIDEIHRLNRAQQDLFLPFLEDGSIVLIGATTENPSFAINNALLSRFRVLSLQPLQEKDLEQLLLRYETQIGSLGISETLRKQLIHCSQGDGRHLCNLIENVEALPKEFREELSLEQILQKKPALYDRGGEGHFYLISALHKSVRGSDPDAALYWFARMLEGGEDPHYIARRLVRIATEDVGLADPQALSITLHAWQVYERLGSPEGELALAEALLYLALSPKSVSAYKAYQKARTLASQTGQLSPPMHILNAPTRLMKEMGYGKGYIYDQETSSGVSGQKYFPEELAPCSLYEPIERGFERELKKRAHYFQKLRGKYR